MLKTIGYTAIAAVAAVALVIGSTGSSEAKGKAKDAAVSKGGVCWGGAPVCATRGNMKFTYRSACYAVNDGAKVVSDKACPAPKAAKAKKAKAKKAAKKAAKPAMKKKM
jgi:hypothetical protein